ncbi:MAG: hypothetical protein WC249_01455 [Patescibacteria group bacterium]
MGDFLKRKIAGTVKGNILRLISGGHVLTLKALNGQCLIYNSKKIFNSFIDSNFVNWNLNKTGVATPKTPVQVHKIVGDGTIMEIFSSMPGNWNQKWLSQNQVIDFCETLSDWLSQDHYSTLFLIKKDENKPIDEAKPQNNLVAVDVDVSSGGLHVDVRHLTNGSSWQGESRHRVVSPKLLTFLADNGELKPSILRLISNGQTLTLKALDGQRLIYNSKKTFKSYIDQNFVDWDLNKTGVATPETLVQVHEIVDNGTFIDIFSSIPGNWNQKWLSQNQVIDFCETLPDWLIQNRHATMFLVKKDENKSVDEDNPQENLVVVNVDVLSDGLYVRVSCLEHNLVWLGEYRNCVVSPQLIPLVS